jgi:hypothetical protein
VCLGVLARVEAWVSAGFGSCWRRAKPVQAFPSEKGKEASEETFRVPGDPFTRCVCLLLSMLGLKKQNVPTCFPISQGLTSVYLPNGDKLARSQMARDVQVKNWKITQYLEIHKRNLMPSI